jgi:hypothetical protein
MVFWCGFCIVANTYTTTTPKDKAETSIIKTKNDGIYKMKHFPGSCRDENINETCDAVYSM